MIMGGRSTPAPPKMPPPPPPPAKMDTPEIAEAELEIESSGPETKGKHRKYRVKGSKGKSVSHSKYKGGGLSGYTQKKAGNK